LRKDSVTLLLLLLMVVAVMLHLLLTSSGWQQLWLLHGTNGHLLLLMLMLRHARGMLLSSSGRQPRWLPQGLCGGGDLLLLGQGSCHSCCLRRQWLQWQHTNVIAGKRHLPLPLAQLAVLLLELLLGKFL
jgi:hypothetical protein